MFEKTLKKAKNVLGENRLYKGATFSKAEYIFKKA